MAQGLGRVWESRPGKWSWALPDGSEGSEPTCEAAIAEVEEFGNRDTDIHSVDCVLAKIDALEKEGK